MGGRKIWLFLTGSSTIRSLAYLDNQTAANIFIKAFNDVNLSGSVIYTHGRDGAKGGSLTIDASGGVAIYNGAVGSNSYIDSSIPHSLPVPVSVIIKSRYTSLYNGQILAYSGSDPVTVAKAHLIIESDLFPSSNHLNSGYYINGYGYIEDRSYSPSEYNFIGKVSNAGNDYSFSISGDLLGINGVLPSLNMPEFESNTRGNACEAYRKGALTLDGRGLGNVGFGAFFN